MKRYSDLLSGYYPGTHIRLIRGGFSVGGSSSKQSSKSETQWPSAFVGGATPAVGGPLTLEQLQRNRPTSTGLFGPTTPTQAPAEPQAPATSAPTTPQFTTAHTPYGDIQIPTNYGTPAPSPNLPQPTGAPVDTGMGAFNLQGLANVGIGQAPGVYTPPTINVPTAQAATGSLSDGDWNAYRSGLYEQQYRPVADETARLGAQQDRVLQSQLAGAGLASSGAGIGQVQRQQQNREAQLQNLSGQAATNAAVQTTGLQAQELQANLAREQQVNLANAANVLAGNTANAANYLSTMGLNEQTAQQARASFLQYLGIQETDLARLDQQALQSISGALDAWLKQYAILAGAGNVSTSEGKSGGGQAGILTFGGSQAPNTQAKA